MQTPQKKKTAFTAVRTCVINRMHCKQQPRHVFIQCPSDCKFPAILTQTYDEKTTTLSGQTHTRHPAECNALL